MSMTDNRNWRDQNTRSNNNQGNRPNHQNGQRGGQGNGGWNDRSNNQNHRSNSQGYGHNANNHANHANHSNQQAHRPGGQGNGTRPPNNNHTQGNGVQDQLELQGTNLGYLFNRLLYTDETGLREYRGQGERNRLIKNRLDHLYQDSRMQLERAHALLAPPEGMATDIIELETQYPGLYVGLGYAHGLPGSNDDIKNGFFFDHTTGLPIVPASSVKGKLRSAFEEMPEYTLLLLQETKFFANADEATVKALLNELFEGEGEKQQPLPMNQRTVFFDAYPCQCSNQGLLGPDSITPHDEKGLQEPNPIKMLKVKGGVRWRFPFRFAPMEEGRKEALVQVFTQLLMDWGIGAKTNVGYGTLIRCRT